MLLFFLFSVGGRFSLEMMIKQFQQIVSSSELVPHALLHFSCERSGFGHRFASAQFLFSFLYFEAEVTHDDFSFGEAALMFVLFAASF